MKFHSKFCSITYQSAMTLPRRGCGLNTEALSYSELELHLIEDGIFMTYQSQALADAFLSFGGDVSTSWADDVVHTSTTAAASQLSQEQLCYCKAHEIHNTDEEFKWSNLGPVSTLQGCTSFGHYTVAILIEPPLSFWRSMCLIGKANHPLLSYHQRSVVIWAALVTCSKDTSVF